MKAFQSVRAEMRETCAELSQPQMLAQPTSRIARVARGRAEEDEASSIDPWMEAAFYGLTHASETNEPFVLVPCFMNGEPAAVIALAQQAGRQTHIMPLFLACQPWMKFSGDPRESGEDAGGGADRTAAADPPAPR